jgi:hypothetical protein
MTRFKIVESVPDKNGFIILAIKPDQDGEFNSRSEALESLYIRQGKQEEQP